MSDTRKKAGKKPAPIANQESGLLDAFYQQELQWQPSEVDDQLEYAFIEVPMNYADPQGRRLTIAVGRIRATNPAKRRGALLALNGGPGGEGGQGRRMPLRYKGTELNEVYDLIGLDPRGLEASTRLYAEITPAKGGFDSRPPDEKFAVIAEDMRLRELGCQRADDGLRPFINSRNTVRDIDVFRGALGEEKISFIGHADGTHVGALYGSMFAHRLDRSVLDCCRNPLWSWREQWKAQSVAFRENAEIWADWAAERDARFGLGKTGKAVMDVIEAVATKLMADPKPSINHTSFDGAVGVGTCFRPLWDEFADIVKVLHTSTDDALIDDAGKAATLLGGTIFQWKITDPKLRSGVTDAVTLEDEWPTDLEFYYREMREFREKYPYGFGIIRVQPWVGIFRTFQYPEPPLTPADVHRNGYPQGLVVASTANTTLRYEGGVAMAKHLGSRLITVADDGYHEIFAMGRNAGVDEIVTRYFVDGIVPESDVTLPGCPRPDIAPGQKGKSFAGKLTEVVVQAIDDLKLRHDKW